MKADALEVWMAYRNAYNHYNDQGLMVKEVENTIAYIWGAWPIGAWIEFDDKANFTMFMLRWA